MPPERSLTRVRTFTPTEEARICDLYGLGFSQSQIGELVDRAPTSINRVLKRNGVTLRPRGTPPGTTKMPHAAVARASFLYEVGKWSVQQIADAEGVNYATIHHRLTVAGVPRRTRSEALRLAYEDGKRKDEDRSESARRGWETRRRNEAVRNSRAEATKLS